MSSSPVRYEVGAADHAVARFTQRLPPYRNDRGNLAVWSYASPRSARRKQTFIRALELGKLVLHRSGEEGIDELWGEPFKAFVLPVENYP